MFGLRRFVGLERRHELDLNGYRECHVGGDLCALRSARRELSIANPASVCIAPPDGAVKPTLVPRDPHGHAVRRRGSKRMGAELAGYARAKFLDLRTTVGIRPGVVLERNDERGGRSVCPDRKHRRRGRDCEREGTAERPLHHVNTGMAFNRE